MKTTLHLIADPLCGWCFGADPLVSEARKIPDLNITLHCGGLFSGPARKVVDAALRSFIESHNRRITEITGQVFGAGFSELLAAGDAVMDSTPPIRGILAAEGAGADPLAYYQAVVRAHFIDGRRVAEAETLLRLAGECGIAAADFKTQFAALGEEDVMAHINASRNFLQQVGGQGFPTFAIEQGCELHRLNHQSVSNNVPAWRDGLQQMLQA